MFLRRVILLLCIFLPVGALPQTGTAETPNYLFSQARTFAQSVQADDSRRQMRHFWLRAIDGYQGVIDRFPSSRQAAQSQYLIGRLYSDMWEVSRISDDVDSAIAAYRLVTTQYSSSRLADDAQYAIGELFLERKGDRSRAYVEFERVVTLFPNGDMASKAKKRLEELADAKPATTVSGRSLVNVSEVLHWSNPNNTRVAIYMGERTKYRYGFLPADKDAGRPRRLYIDILNARLDPALSQAIPIEDGLLVRARAAQFSPDTVRIVLDMQSVGEYKVFPLMSPFRLIVDVYGEKSAEERKQQQIVESSVDRLRAILEGSRAAPAPAEPTLRAPPPDLDDLPLTRQLGLHIRRVVIDPGHGGRDPGAVGVGNVYEKDIALNISRRVAEKIRERMKIDVVLTRDDDTFIPLEGRPGIARTKRGDLFISIHANAAASPNAYGIETYHLDMARDRSAVLVAARENASSEASVTEQQSILGDLMLTSKRNDSIKLARAVQGTMISNLSKSYDGIRDLGVKGAPFVVLIGADVPAILVETGFISNPREAKRLQDERYVDRLADSIAQGVEEYSRKLRFATF